MHKNITCLLALIVEYQVPRILYKLSVNRVRLVEFYTAIKRVLITC